jgi:hypothetical protein
MVIDASDVEIPHREILAAPLGSSTVPTLASESGFYQGATVVPPHSSGSTSRIVWVSSQR